MNSEVKMSVSSLTRTDDKNGVYVLFSDGEKSAEFVVGNEESGHHDCMNGHLTNATSLRCSETESKRVPGCKVISNKGFDEDELKQLRDYVDNEQDYIFSLAKTVNPMKAFMGE